MQFVVACQNTIVRGTDGAFNIRGNVPEQEVEVIIVSGNIEFSGVGKKEYKKLTLKEGERGLYDKKEQLSKGKNHRKDYKWWQKKNLKSRFKRFLDKIKRTFK
jgi:ferric-dicitrate binding protein FerR (iron transport regulator)